MTEYEESLLRLECLKLAIPVAGNNRPYDIALTATQLYAFVAHADSATQKPVSQSKKDKHAGK